MNEAIRRMLDTYNPKSRDDYIMALKEIIQEICLLGLWRAKFFEKAAFYGGSCLRLFYKLDRFSEDLDFSLLETNEDFFLSGYFAAIKDEIESYGFNIEIIENIDKQQSQIESAFIKTNTKIHLLMIGLSQSEVNNIPRNQLIRIKFEIDKDPPLDFNTETKFLLNPLPFGVKVFVPSDLFAGKMHALLCRAWKQRVKGRDWYDFIWFVQNNIPLNLKHLKARLVQTGHFEKDEALSKEKLCSLLKTKIESLDIVLVKKDVLPFIKDSSRLEGWSKDLLFSIADSIRYKTYTSS
jgi:predicted nucleotidyltransferase component of viral defense system